MRTVDRLGDATREIYMVILQENHIEQADTVVHAATDANSLLLDHTHTRSSLAGVEHMGLRAFQLLHILTGGGSDAAHALHDVEHQTLGLQQRLYLTLHYEGDVALLYLCAILDEDRHLQLGIEGLEDTACHLYTGQYAIFLDDQLALTHLRGGNATERGVIAIANVLGESQLN